MEGAGAGAGAGGGGGGGGGEERGVSGGCRPRAPRSRLFSSPRF